MTNTRTTTPQARNTKALALSVLAILLALSLTLLAAQRQANAVTFPGLYTVNQTTDVPDENPYDNVCDINSGVPGNQCTMWAAIEQANFHPGADAIGFGFTGQGPFTITLDSQLPPITESVQINGYSQDGSSVNTLAKGTNAKLMVQLDGAQVSGENSGLYVDAPDVAIRGLVINGFTYGIWVEDAAANTKIEGNFVGTYPSGTTTPGDSGEGVAIYDSSGTTNNTVGGPTPAARNLISGTGGGIDIDSDGNRVSGNLIGTQRDGKSPLGNSFGVLVSGSHNVVGGATPAYANTIASNDNGGVYVQTGFGSPVPVGDRILSNSILSNGYLGIDLGNDGVTPNDAGDADAGANNLQNKPVLSSARKSSTGKTVVKGALHSTPNKSYKLQFFSNPQGTDEGERLLGQKTVSTDGTGNVSFRFATTKKIRLGRTITATATNAVTGDTSEFSTPRKVVAA